MKNDHYYIRELQKVALLEFIQISKIQEFRVITRLASYCGKFGFRLVREFAQDFK